MSRGAGTVQAGNRALALTPSTAGFYAQNESRLAARRQGGELHQFITVELSLEFLERHVPVGERGLDPRLGRLFSGDGRRAMVVSEPMRLTSDMRQMVVSLRRPPVYAAAQRLWYQAKVLEVAAALLYQPLAEEELFCARWKRLSQERVQRVVAILKENLAEPPSLEELGRRIGCSHYYLSRLFTQEMGKTISAHLRDLRLEQAAERLREGKMNVTEVAVAVGYSRPEPLQRSFPRDVWVLSRALSGGDRLAAGGEAGGFLSVRRPGATPGADQRASAGMESAIRRQRIARGR